MLTTPFALRLTSLPLPLVPRLCPQRSQQRRSMGRKAYPLDMEHSRMMRRTTPPPPLPHRNPFRRVSDYSKPLPLLPKESFHVELELLPAPLFSRSITLPPTAMHVATVELPSPASSPIICPSDSSSASSVHSWVDSIAASPPCTPATSVPNSPSLRAQSFTSLSPPPTLTMPSPVPDPTPRPMLKRKKTPRRESLRSLRAKDSDASLQKMYDQRTSVYLDLTPPAKSALRQVFHG
jgi:hypothetical protein